jgi:hypothetical protein
LESREKAIRGHAASAGIEGFEGPPDIGAPYLRRRISCSVGENNNALPHIFPRRNVGANKESAGKVRRAMEEQSKKQLSEQITFYKF